MISEIETTGVIDFAEDDAEGSVDLTPGNSAPAISDPKELETTINKIDYALGEDSPGREEIYVSHLSGQQDRFRLLAEASERMRLRTELRREADRVLQTAVAEGRSLSPEEVQYISVLQERRTPPPSVAIEQKFADRAVQELFQEELSELPGEKGFDLSVATGDYLAKQQVALRITMDAARKVEEQSWFGWGADLAKMAFPGYVPIKLHNRIKGASTDTIWSGTNREQQYRSLYMLPLPEFEERLQTAVDELMKDNPQLAAAFANGAVSFSSTDAALDDIFMSLDILDVLPAAGVVAAGTVGIARSALRGKIRSVADDLGNPDLTKTDMAVLRGTAQEGAEQQVVADLSAVGMVDGTRPERLVGEMNKTSNGFADIDSVLRGSESLTYEAQRRIRESFERNKNILQSNLMPGQNTHVIRLSPEAIDQGLKLARDEQARLYPNLEDHVLRVQNVRESERVFGGVDYVEIHYGKKDGTPFASQKAAENYARRFLRVDPEMFVPTQHGNSWTLKVERSVNETSLDLADLRLNTGYAVPETWLNGWLQAIRMGDATRGPMANQWAKVATYGAQGTAERLAEVTKTIGKMGKAESARLADVMQDAMFKHRQVTDPKTGQPVTVQGVFYHNQLELENAYRQKGYSLPSAKESQAYWTFRQLMDYDLKQRNIGMWRDKARQGITEHQVGWVRLTDGAKEKINLPPVEGRIVSELPDASKGVFTVAWSDIKSGKTGFALSTSDRGWYRQVNELLGKDYKIIQVSDKNAKDLKDAVRSKGEPVDYLIVRDWKERPLSFHQIPASEGGHFMYPQTGGFVKQPQVHGTGFGRQIYDGDLTVHHQSRTQDARALADAYETARRMFLTNDPRFNTFAAENLPYDGAALRKKFEDGTFNPERPFVYTEHGQSTKDILKLSDNGVIDPNDSAHSLSGTVSGRFTQERGERLTSAAIDQSQNNPAFKLTGAPVMDPMRAMTRALSDLARSRFFEDYVHQNAENFVTQFARTMKVSDAEFRADPMRFIREPVWNEAADPKMVAAAKNARRNLLYMLGQDSYDMGLMKTFKQKMLDSVLAPYGKSGRLLDRHQWTKEADPAVIARSAVFDMYLGLFNPLQFPLQGQGVTLVAAIDGSMTRAAQGAALGWMARMRGMASTNPGAQTLFNKATTKALGLPADVVEEAYQTFLHSGMNTFGGAYNRLDDFLPQKMFETGKGPLRKFLDAGRFFFREGNTMHQSHAYMVSYLRWKQSPGNRYKTPNQRDMAQILDRASLYYNDMTRASNSAALSSSLASVPTQFSSFHRNLTENLLGFRMTAPEKARVMMMYSLLYGAPVGNPVSMATAPLWPMAESIRQTAIEEGMDLDSDFLTNAFYNGITQAFLTELTGTQYDTERYAPAGLPWLKELLSGEFLEVIQGPAGTGLGRAIESVAPFYYSFMNIFSNTDDDVYKLTRHDFIDAARNIASINNAAKAYYAVTAGRIETKDGALQSRIDAGPVDALLIGALGLTPQEVADAYLMIQSQKEEDEHKAEITREAMKLLRRHLKAAKDGNTEEALVFAKNAKSLLRGAGLNELEMTDVFMRAMTENQSLFEQVSPNFSLRDWSKRGERFQQQLDQKYGDN